MKREIHTESKKKTETKQTKKGTDRERSR